MTLDYEYDADLILQMLDASHATPKELHLSLLAGQTAWNPSSTKTLIYGPAELVYLLHPDGGVELLITPVVKALPTSEAQARAEGFEIALKITREFHDGMHQCVGGNWWTDSPKYKGSIANIGVCPPVKALLDYQANVRVMS